MAGIKSCFCLQQGLGFNVIRGLKEHSQMSYLYDTQIALTLMELETNKLHLCLHLSQEASLGYVWANGQAQAGGNNPEAAVHSESLLFHYEGEKAFGVISSKVCFQRTLAMFSSPLKIMA